MILKFLFDRIVAFFGLLFLWPVILITAILVKVKMPGGPAFFVQKRVGKDGKLFNCHKFRSMTVKHSGSTVSVAGDSRITPFGAKLRHYKIDELPGLWDVLIGNMSFVGPRPDVPGYADKLEGADRDVLKLRPGITGPATLKYRVEDEMIAEFVQQIKAGKNEQVAKFDSLPDFASMTNQEILEAIESMTLLQVKELVDAMKEKFGVTGAIAVAGGPTKISPASSRARANRGFSDRKPYPGCTACAPVWRHASITLSTSR